MGSIPRDDSNPEFSTLVQVQNSDDQVEDMKSDVMMTGIW